MDWIEKTLRTVERKYDGIPYERALGLLAEGKMQAFPVSDESAIFAGLADLGWVHIYAAYGNIKELVNYLPALEKWYRRKGGKYLTIDGRIGWTRVLSKMGYHRSGNRLIKDIGYG